ncbi:MAG: 30S ribosomal protein S9 [Candidatus Omnitrophica bacterium]|nr:30S ribosomal protein S9 [Candidatus Omnitrophota bacterium]
MTKNFFYATGRRKSAIAKVWIFPDEKGRSINGRQPLNYLGREELVDVVEEPFKSVKLQEKFRLRANVLGGGTAGQAGAIKLGIARALVKYDESLKPLLKKDDLLTRDPREKERKKFGQKGARKNFQYTKR